MTVEPSHRLPTRVRPHRYDLLFAPDLDAATFEGRAEIEIEVTEATDEIVLHGLDLEIVEAVLLTDGAEHALDAEVLAETEMVRLRAPGRVEAGDHVLRLRWTGELTDALVGFYRSTYVDDRGETRTIACTQFESTHARRAFPCWDEPAFKAVFEISLLVDEDLLAVSNGAERSSEPADDGRRLVRFTPTIPMSTYLVAMVVGPMEATDPVEVDGVPLRVITPLGRLHLTGFALEAASFALRHLIDWYAIPYPGDKIDLVAIPDFSFGAMENQGCITFRETALLIDPEGSTRDEQMRVADVIAHELAHMWFGNLVTMAWWEGIWLNEAFATFMELDTTDRFRPDWERWVEFGLDRSAAFDTDSLTTTRPIEFEVITADDAEAMFDVLTYEKGSSVVRMLQRYLGEDRFRAGIRRYLADHALGNTVTTDLWDAIEAVTNEPVRRVMDTWILRGGHPVVSIEREGDRGLRLRQRRFVYESDPAAAVTAPVETDRAIPVVLRLEHGSETVRHRVLLDGPETRIDLDRPFDRVIGNAAGDGFYRVHLAEAELRALLDGPLDLLDPLERHGLVEDEWALFLAGDGSLDRLFRVIRALGDDDHLAVWRRILAVLRGVDRHVGDDRRPWAGFVTSLLSPVHARAADPAPGRDPESARVLRAELDVALALIGGLAGPRTEARAHLLGSAGDGDGEGFVSTGAPVPPEQIDAWVRIAAVDPDPAIRDELRRRADVAETAQDRLRHLGALADSHDPDRVVEFCQLVLTDEVRTQDGPFLLRRALTNPRAQDRVWETVEERWGDITTRFPSASLPRLLEGIRSIGDADLARRVSVFLDDHTPASGRLVVAQHRERMWVEVAAARRIRAGSLGSPP